MGSIINPYIISSSGGGGGGGAYSNIYSFHDSLPGNNKQIPNNSMTPPLVQADFTNGTAGSFTFSVWMNNDSLSRYRSDWVSGASYFDKVQIEVRSSYVRYVQRAATGGWQSNYIWITQNTGTWYHYCFSIDTATNTFAGYVNGANKGVNTNSDIGISIWNGATNGGWGVAHYVGYIDEVSIFDGALSDSDVADLYNGGTVPDLSTLSTYSNCVDWWRFDNDTYNGSYPDTITGEKGHDTIIGTSATNANLLSTNKP